MSAIPNDPIRITEAEYLALEESNEFKHEYVDGEIFAMAGASEKHIVICANIGGILYNELRKRPCKFYGSAMRVKAEALSFYTYPDLSIVCGEAKFSKDKPATLLNPMMLIEVLSPSTEAYDRGKKFKNYREMESFQEYLLVSQDSATCEHYVRKENGKWEFSDAAGLDAEIKLSSINCRIRLADIYEKVDFEPEDTESLS